MCALNIDTNYYGTFNESVKNLFSFGYLKDLLNTVENQRIVNCDETAHTHTVCVPYYKAAPYNISHTKIFSRAK